MIIDLPYGKQYIHLSLAVDAKCEVIAPDNIPPSPNPLATTMNALDYPVNGVRLEKSIGAKSAAIAVNDKTRPVPHEFLLPPLLHKLAQMGLGDDAIEFIIASGTHKPMLFDEYDRILPPEIVRRYPIKSHDCDDKDQLETIGTTRRKSLVLVNRRFYEADLRIVVGNIEPHHFMGFSGGAKSAAIGLTGRETINQNHSMLIHPEARIGVFDENPMRQDVEEIGQLIGIHYAVNAILNGNKDIVEVFTGDPFDVMKAGIPFSMNICQTQVEGLFDLVIASAGGHPKDINLYQSQKALTHASLITKTGGIIILVAACPEGSGNRAFEQFMDGILNVQEVEEKFVRQGFSVGPHKAYQIAQQLKRVKIFLVSEMDPNLVKKLQLIPYTCLNAAVQAALEILPPNIRIAIMPRATNTIPLVVNVK